MIKKLFLFSILLAFNGNIYSMKEAEKDEQSNKESITDFIVWQLKECKAKNWCKQFPGRTVCHSYFKELFVNQNIISSSAKGSYAISIKDRNQYSPVLHSEFDLSENRECFYGRTRIWVKGPKAIEEFKKRFSCKYDPETNKEYIEDENTLCEVKSVEDLNGNQEAFVVCGHTQNFYDKLVKELSAEFELD